MKHWWRKCVYVLPAPSPLLPIFLAASSILIIYLVIILFSLLMYLYFFNFPSDNNKNTRDFFLKHQRTQDFCSLSCLFFFGYTEFFHFVDWMFVWLSRVFRLSWWCLPMFVNETK